MAGIIKVGQRLSPTAAEANAPYQFDDMGEQYLGRVRGEAHTIIAEARMEAARIKAQAAEDGKAAALQAVEASLRKRIDEQSKSLMKALAQAVQQIEQSRQAWQRHWERHAVQVAMAIARRVVRREVAHAPEIALDMVRETLQMAAGHQPIVVRMNPDDYRTLGPLAEQIVEQLRLVGQAQIVADPSVASGGCKVLTDYGAIDGQVATQLARIAEELLDEWAGERGA
jgi:flagellar assembly protein FliH